MPDLSSAELSSLPPPRPRTAPTKPTVHIPIRAKSFEEASSAFGANSFPPPPPLPLVLTSVRAAPPLRKKKSFSRVSNWLFPSATSPSEHEHTRNISMDSVTNTPKPVTSREGFYQCVDPNASTRNPSFTSVTTVSTLESEVDEPTLPTDWTPESSPRSATRDLSRMRTFGEREKEAGIVMTHEFGSQIQQIQHRMSSVGVAF